MPPFGVIFDNDGVLVDSEHFSIEAYQRAITEQGVELREGDTERNCGLTDADILRDMEERYGASLDFEKFSARKAELYREIAAAGEMRAFPGARELLLALKAEGIPCILASSGSREKIEFNLQRSGLADVVPMYLSGEDFTRGKPDPEIFLRAAEKLGIAPQRCVVIEDSINGLKAARAAGAHAIGITNTFPAEKLQPHADTVITSLTKLSTARLKALIEA
jgi:HAD superfamily hydrolase (TIGR01509 family)